MKHCVVIADWASDAVKTQEFRSALLGHTNGLVPPTLSFIPLTDDKQAGKALNQLLTTEQRLGDPNNYVYFVSIKESVTFPFYIARMKNGALVCGPQYGYIFSYIHSNIEYLYSYTKQLPLHHDNLFPSRDIFSATVALLITEQEDTMDMEEVRASEILPL